MKSLVLLVVVVLTNSLTASQKCGIPKTKKINCILWDNLNVKSLQGEVFRFTSNCGYKVVEYETDGHLVSVQVENNLAKNTIQVSIDALKYELKLSGLAPVLVTGQRSYGLNRPVTVDEIVISRPGRLLTANFEKIGLTIRWDHADNFIEIILNNKEDFEVSGLCSKECGNNIAKFINSWSIRDGCLATFPTTNCQTSMRRSQRYCMNLFHGTFQECEKDVSMESFIETCSTLYCGCNNNKKESCLCNLLDAYSKTCTVQAGQHIEWRSEKLCQKKCANDEQDFLQCSPNPNGNGVCGGTAVADNARTECVEGCYCPNGLLLHNGKCFTVDQCPCTAADGNEVAPGRSIPSDCNTCTCRNGQFECTKRDCYREAAVFGDPHYVTFDGKRYDFMGKCTYYLIKGKDFSIVGDHYVWERNKYVKNALSRAPSYTKVIYINIGDDTITLKPNRLVDLNGQQINHFPHITQGTTISQPTLSLVQVELPNKIQVIWNGVDTATFRITTALKGRVRGLLGNNNFNPNDDFTLPNGTLTTNPDVFGHAWRVGNSDENCQTHVPVPHPCEINPAQKSVAEKVCSVLKNNIFRGCGELDVDIIYENCVYDCCENSHLGNKCACTAVKAHSSTCASKEHPIDWIQQAPHCVDKCPEGLVYKACHNQCESSCEYIGLTPTCHKQCVEGCACPTGQTLNEFNKCKPIEECKCKLHGKYYNSGFKYVENKHDLRSCTKARWESTKVSIEEAAKYPSLDELLAKCDKSKGLEFTSCKKDPVRTCTNMHKYEEGKEQHCNEGCECSDGLVWNEDEMICVAPKECPCHHSGRSYNNLEERWAINEKCICQNKQWKCLPDNTRSGHCSILGNYHIRTFGGTFTSFSIDCDIVLAQGTKGRDTFKIAMTPDTIKFEYKQDDKNHKIDIPRKTGLQYIGDAFHFNDFKSSKVYDIDLGVKLAWYSDGWTHIHIQPGWAKEVEGMCAKEAEDDLDYSGDYEDNNCNLDIIKKADIFEEDGTPLDSQCELLKGKSFEECASKIPVNTYFDMCALGVDNLAQKEMSNEEINKFECGVFAAYAQECTNIGSPVNWRTDRTCVPNCGSSQYTSCVSTCTCDTIKDNRVCKVESCIEGCVPTICSKDHVYTDSTYTECINIDQCTQWKCLQKLKSMPSNCRCDNGKITCPTTPAPTTTPKTTHVPTTERTTTTTVATTETLIPASRKLLDNFEAVKRILDCKVDCHKWHTLFKELSPKDKQLIKVFTNNIRDSGKDVKCLAYLKDKRKCTCKFGREDCTTNRVTDHTSENIGRIDKMLELLDFIQAHLACLVDSKKDLGHCSCLLGRKACTYDDTEGALVYKVVINDEEIIRVVYPDIIKAEQETVTNFLNLHYINEQLTCINATRNQPCICQDGKPECRFDVSEQYIPTIQKEKDSKEQTFNKHAANSRKQLLCYANLKGQEGHTCSCENGYEICVQSHDANPVTTEIVETYVQADVKPNQVVVQLENAIKCTEQLGEDAKDCVCDHGKVICPEDIPTLTTTATIEIPTPSDDVSQNLLASYTMIKNIFHCTNNSKNCREWTLTFQDLSSKENQIINVFRTNIRDSEKDVKCLAYLKDKRKCTCKFGREDCETDSTADHTDENIYRIGKLVELFNFIQTHLACLVDLKKNPGHCSCLLGRKACAYDDTEDSSVYKFTINDEENIRVVYPDIIKAEQETVTNFLNLHYIDEQLTCINATRNQPCICEDGKPECRFDVSEQYIPTIQKEKDSKEQTFNKHAANSRKQLLCYANLKGQEGHTCSCENGYEICVQSHDANPVTTEIVETYVQADVKPNQVVVQLENAIKCTEQLGEDAKDCVCDHGKVICPEDIPTLTTTATMEIPTPSDDVSQNLLASYTMIKNIFHCKNNSKKSREWTLTFQDLSSKENQIINVFRTNIRDSEKDVKCLAYLKDKRKCTCKFGREDCETDSTADHTDENIYRIGKLVELFEFIQTHLACLIDLRKSPGHCSCLLGRKACPIDDTEDSSVYAFAINDVENIRVVYPDIIKAEQETVTNFLNLHYINEQLTCINATRNQPCICEDGKPECRFDVSEQYIPTIQKEKDSKEQTFNKHEANSRKQLLCYANLKGQEGHTCSCENGYEICVQNHDAHPVTMEIVKTYVQADVKPNQVVVQLENAIKCTEQLGEDAKDCVCDHGKVICPEDIPTLTTTEKCSVPKKYRDFTLPQVELQSVLENLQRLLKSQTISNVSEKDKQIIKIYQEYIDEFNGDLSCFANLKDKSGYTCKNGKILPQDGEQVDWTKENNNQIDGQLAFVKYINAHVQCLSSLEKGCACFGGQKICKGEEQTQVISYSIIQQNEVNTAKQFYYLQHLHAELKCLAHVKNVACACRNGQPDCEVLDAGNEKKFIEINLINEKRQKLVDEFLSDTYVQLQCYTNLNSKSGLCTCEENLEVCVENTWTIANSDSMLDMYEHFTFDFEFIKKDFMCRLELADKPNCACISGEVTCNTKTQPPKVMPTIIDLPTEIRSVETKIETTLTELELSREDKDLLKTYSTFITYINSKIPSITSEQFRTYKDFIHYIHRQLNCLGSLNSNLCSCSNVQMCGTTPKTNAVARILETYNEQISTDGHVYIELQLKCFNSMVDKSGLCTCQNGTLRCQKNTNIGHMYIYSRDELELFYYHQLNCIPHLKSGCICVNGGQICKEDAKEYMEVTSEEVSEYHVTVLQLEEYFKLQLKCLMTLNYKFAFESCVNGKITFPNEDVCVKSTCPPNTRTIRKCERCCPICEELYCTVEVPSGSGSRKVGESWMENPCTQCTCINHPLIGLFVQCTHQRCSAPESKDIVFEKIIDKSQCCPKYKPVGCKHNGNVYDLNRGFVVNKSLCETVNCTLDTDGKVYKRIERVICNSTCSTGFEYKPKADACCGECHQNACLINGQARAIGQVWMSEEGCEMVCLKEGGIFKIVQRRTCPQITHCSGIRIRRGCCHYCIEYPATE